MSYLETLIEKPAIIIDIGYAYTKCGKLICRNYRIT